MSIHEQTLAVATSVVIFSLTDRLIEIPDALTLHYMNVIKFWQVCQHFCIAIVYYDWGPRHGSNRAFEHPLDLVM